MTNLTVNNSIRHILFVTFLTLQLDIETKQLGK
jgi:hypothetical protein